MLAERLRVDDLDVVDVDEVLLDELPVARQVEDELGPERAVLHPEDADVLGEVREERLERLGGRVEADPDPSAPRAHLEPGQPALRGVEARRLLHERRTQELAGQVVRPRVVGALELAHVAVAHRDLDPAVRAHVREGVDGPGGVAHDDRRLAHDPERHVVAGARDFLLARHAEPVLHEHPFLLARVHLGRVVDEARHVAGPVQGLAGCVDAHAHDDGLPSSSSSSSRWLASNRASWDRDIARPASAGAASLSRSAARYVCIACAATRSA